MCIRDSLHTNTFSQSRSVSLGSDPELRQVYGFLSVVAGLTTIWTLAAISVERAWVILCISRARAYHLFRSYAANVVWTIWAAAATLALAPLLGWNRYIYEVKG